MRVLLTSASESVKESMRLAVAGLERRLGERLEFVEASNGERGAAMARKFEPEVILADEIQSRAGAFAMTKDLRDQLPPYRGVIVILLDRPHDAWLARWSGADAWFVKPADPFALADRVVEALEARRAAADGDAVADGAAPVEKETA
jgi:DNA-binding response OmpR family regulator